jgi:hypothetical protein
MSEKDQGPQVLYSRKDPDSHAVHEEDERRARALNELIRLWVPCTPEEEI